MLRKIKSCLFLFLVVGSLAGALPAVARTDVTDWYIKNFDSEIIVNKDSSLDITETITADCGNAVGKHGIFRILPEEINVTDHGWIKTPVELVSITDADGKAYAYTASQSSADKTVTWKIGDADRTVQGVNVYIIKYRVKNVVRFWNDNFDELYWNLTGNFWDLEIDQAHIVMRFPEEIKNDEVSTDIYSGSLGQKNGVPVDFFWGNDADLVVDSGRTLSKREGITASVTFPKGIFTPYRPTFWETYGNYLFLIIPLAVLFFCFWIWQKYGQDPREKGTVIAEYDVPGGLSPIALGMLEKNGRMDNKFITAEIVQLAVGGIITIKEIENKILFFSSKDYELVRTGSAAKENELSAPQRAILDGMFQGGDVVRLSSLKNEFYKKLKNIGDKANGLLIEKKLIVASGLKMQTAFMAVGLILIFLTFWLISLSGYLAAAVGASGVIVFAFSFIMPKRTEAGTEINWQLKGFKLFMQTVDKDRAAFYEKENMFEKCLPYAILFGMTGEWISRMKEIYGADYYASHAPVWYTGAALSSFDADSFTAAMDSLSSGIAASTSSPSGSGGAGGAGGGGGGGGGGGW